MPKNKKQLLAFKKINYFSPMKNNSAAFKQLYEQYKVLVYNVALNYLQNIEDAEEITQKCKKGICKAVYRCTRIVCRLESRRYWIHSEN